MQNNVNTHSLKTMVYTLFDSVIKLFEQEFKDILSIIHFMRGAEY